MIDSSSITDASRRAGGLVGKWGLLIGIGIGIALSVVGTRLLAGSAAKTKVTSPAVAQTQPQADNNTAQSVTVMTVKSTPIAQTIAVTGTVNERELLEISPQVSGLQIQQILVKEGERVQVGQTLAVLDDTLLQADIRQAEAQLKAAQATVQQRQAELNQAKARQADAKSNLNRYQSLANQGAISAQDLQTRATDEITTREAVGVAQADIYAAEADVLRRQAELERLRAQLQQGLVRAPAGGKIVARTINDQQRIARLGDVSSVNQPLFWIIRDDLLDLQAPIPQQFLPQVNTGIPVNITSDSDARIKLQGRIREIAPLVDADSRTAMVKADLPANDLLRPGMFLRAAITVGSNQGLTIPANAILPQADGRSIVYLLSADNTAIARVVETGARLDGDRNSPEVAAEAASEIAAETAQIEILSGLQPGDRIIVAGAGFLKDGDPVEVVSEF
ncbi:MAG: efflux RND transporter periplasmic adaptor subunit [Cyanothece sp. SIO1E1]|nr:efflux RND transporter periplasmic adaptor subunit [Cyanothece sp. SIO1E1]